MQQKKIKLSILSISFLLASIVVSGQNLVKDFTVDSVDLQTIVKKVIETYPSVLKAEEALNAVNAGIGMAKSAYLPDVDLSAGYTRIGPVPSITIPNLGTFEMAPGNNYNASVNVHQNIYDFSKTKKNIEYAESGKAIVEKSIDLVRQKLTLITISNYYSLAYLQEAIQIKEVQLGILNQHLDFITRKQQTGTATEYEVLSTKVRISAAKNQKLDLESSLNNQLAILNSLLGLPENTHIKVRNILQTKPVNIEFDSLINYAMTHRIEILLAALREKQAEIHLESVKIENNPSISAFLSAGVKDGYFPDMNAPKANYAAGLGLKVPIFTANRHKNLLQIASSDINSIKLDVEQSKREISSEVYRNANDLEASLRKINESKLQLDLAEEARKLADLSFKAGSLTNLDLLDSESLEAESRLSLMRARIDFMVISSKLELSIGNQGY